MTPDPRTEEIRKLSAHMPGHPTFSVVAASDAIAHLLGRIEALEGGREVEQRGLRNAIESITLLHAERDRYRAVVDAARVVLGDLRAGEQTPPADVDGLEAALAALDGDQ